ncbi:MAG: hypothetical protein HY007_00075 [Candidatus Sungbacteria bacterium]|nr:hypothetical protein [Candidatus Sungbacteria bacterium]
MPREASPLGSGPEGRTPFTDIIESWKLSKEALREHVKTDPSVKREWQALNEAINAGGDVARLEAMRIEDEDDEERIRILDRAIVLARIALEKEEPALPAAGGEEPSSATAREILHPIKREQSLTDPYNAQLRETVWRALNPTAPGSMPENYEIPEGLDPAQGLRAKAEGFITARQKDLRMRNIAVILGDDKGGTKKGFSQEKRKAMLRDLEGIIEDNEYDALAKHLGERAMPHDPTGAQNDLLTIRLNALQTECRPYLDPMADNAHKTASNEFYAELGQKIFEDNTIGAGASAEEQAILKKHTGVSLLSVMTGIDGDFEKMKREQFLAYADQKEKTRFRKTLETFWHNYQTLPTWKKVVIGSSISAGVATAGVFFLAPSIPLLAGQSLLLTKMGAGAYAGSRLARSAAAFPLAGFLRSIMIPQAEKKYARQQAELRSVHAQKAGEAVDTARTWLAIAEDMQKTAQENERAMEKLKGKQWWKRMGVNVGVGVVAGVAVGFAMPKVADAVAGLGGGGKGSTPPLGDPHMGFGKPTDSFPHSPPASPPPAPPLPASPPSGMTPTPVDPFALDPSPKGPAVPTAPAPAPSITPPSGPGAGLPQIGGDSWIRKIPVVGETLDKYMRVGKSVVDDLTYKPKTPEPPTTGGHASGGTTPPPDDIYFPGERVSSPRGTGTAATTPEAAATPGGAAASAEHFKSFSIGKAGSVEGALQKASGLSGGQAHIKVVQYIQQIKANQTTDEAANFIKKLKSAGYSQAEIDQGLAASTPRNYSNFFNRAFRHMSKDGSVGYDPTTQKMTIADESFFKPKPARPAVSHQPTWRPAQQPPSPALKPLDQTIQEAQKIDLARRAQADVIADAQREVIKQQNLTNPDFNPRRYRTTISDLNQQIPVKDFVTRVKEIASEFPKSRGDNGGPLPYTGDIVPGSRGGSPNILDERHMRIVERVADRMGKIPPADQNLPLGEALKKYPLADNAPVGRPQAAAPMPPNPEALEVHVATPLEEIQTRPGSQSR